MKRPKRFTGAMMAAALALGGCGSGDDAPAPPAAAASAVPRLSAATPGTRNACAELAATFSFGNTTISAAELVAAGTLDGYPVGEHCKVSGEMHRRNGTNGSYAIGFEVRLPTAWNGRFLYQANGGADGAVSTALGPDSGAGTTTSALGLGFAVISSDAGHANAQNGAGATNFGLDPQARLDYGYQAVAKLTPMARGLVQAAYGRPPDRMYFAGCSNGGRHGMVAAARYADQYDGILSGDPGFNLPKAAVQVAWDTQQLTSIATAGSVNPMTGGLDLGSGFTTAERQAVADRIVGKCDGLDGASDGMVLNVTACQAAFKLQDDVPTCTGTRDGTCLTAAQKTAIGNLFGGARNSAGTPLYASFPFDPGVRSGNWSIWMTYINVTLGATSLPYMFTTPPTQVPQTDLQSYLTSFSMDSDAPKISATQGAFTESAQQFMTPPNPTDLSRLRDRGAKLMVYHGTGDPIFSSDDTAAWYTGLRQANGGDASAFARYFEVPGMNHCSGGPATDRFAMLAALVDWVEKGQAPDRIVASVRADNTDIPAGWSSTRSRPLCVHPKTARYQGSGSFESADNFSCQ